MGSSSGGGGALGQAQELKDQGNDFFRKVRFMAI
jgi:hypothetical protein